MDKKLKITANKKQKENKSTGENLRNYAIAQVRKYAGAILLIVIILRIMEKWRLSEAGGAGFRADMALDVMQLALEVRADNNVGADLLTGVSHSGGIAVAERLTYLVEGVVSLLPDKVHR